MEAGHYRKIRGFTAEEWATKLHEQLEDIEGINGITGSTLRVDSRSGAVVDRVVVDIEPWHYMGRRATLEESARLDRVHRTVGMIARGELSQPSEVHQSSRIRELLARVIRQ